MAANNLTAHDNAQSKSVEPSSAPDLSSASFNFPGQEALFSMMRRVGLGAAVLGSSMGLTGFAEKRADAGIVVSLVPDAQYVERGQGYAGPYMGPGINPSGGALSFSLEYYLPGYGNVTRHTSATWINSQYAITSAHNLSDIMAYNPSMSVGTGPNFRTDPGMVVPIEDIRIHPSYTGSGAGGNGADLAILKISIPIPGGVQMTIANSTPPAGSLVNAAGYGVTGTPEGGAIYPQDGNIRGGTIALDSIPATNIGNPDIYKSLYFDNSTENLNIRPYSGDSGSPIFNLNNELLGITTGGGLAASDRTAFYLDLTDPDRRQFVLENTVQTAAVPEPSSLALSLAAAGILGGLGAYRSRKEKNSEPKS